MIKRMILIAFLLSGVSCISLNAMMPTRPDFLDPAKHFEPGERERALVADINVNIVIATGTPHHDAEYFESYKAALKRWLADCTLDFDLKCQDEGKSTKEYVLVQVQYCDRRKEHLQLQLQHSRGLIDPLDRAPISLYEWKIKMLDEILKILGAYTPPVGGSSLGGAPGSIVARPSSIRGSVPEPIVIPIFTDPARFVVEGRIERDLCLVIYKNIIDSPYKDDAALDTQNFKEFLQKLKDHLEKCAIDGRLDLDKEVDCKIGVNSYRLSPKAYVSKMKEVCTSMLGTPGIDFSTGTRKLNQLRQVQEVLNNYQPRVVREGEPRKGGGRLRLRRGFLKILGYVSIPVVGFAIWKLFFQKDTK